MENKFLQEYLENNEALHAEVKGKKGKEDTLISIKDVEIILDRQKKFYEQRLELKEKRIALKFYKKLNLKIGLMLNAELELEDYETEVYHKIVEKTAELDDFKLEIDLPDEEWENDEIIE